MGQHDNEDDFDEYQDDDGYKSKSQLKREMSELQAMGERLCSMPAEKIKAMDLPEAIREAALFALTIKKYEAVRRHRQYVGKLMRAEEVDIDALRQVLDSVDQKKRKYDERFHRVEEWRDRLMAGDDALVEEIVTIHPEVDRQHLRTLVRNAIIERKAEKPPKAFRTLFKFLRKVAGH
ncbi:MAG: DUF615 domain-containing protein [Proteobacteria bacterium]|nr:DUF615 domain-containing protein [Pseudomonadota bacterium]